MGGNSVHDGLDVSGGYGVHPHAVLSPFECEGPHQLLYRSLTGGIGSQCRYADASRDRGCEGDGALRAGVGYLCTGRCLCKLESPAQVHPQDRVPLLGGVVQRWLDDVDPGVGHHGI